MHASLLTDPQAYIDAVLVTRPMGFWPGGLFSGAAVVNLANAAFHGALHSSVAIRQGVLARTDTPSLRFTGSVTGTGMNPGNTGVVGDVFSLSVIVRVAAGYAPAAGTLLCRDTNSYTLRFAAGKLQLAKINVANIVDSTIDVNDGNAHHFMAMKNGATSTYLFIDGVDRTGTVTNQTCANAGTLMSIGSQRGGTNPFTGYASMFAIWSRALTPAEAIHLGKLAMGA